MSENASNCKYIPRRYSLSNSEKTTIGKSLLRYIQVSHYFKRPTVSTINENKRQELINKHKSEIEKKNIQEIIKNNNANFLNEVNNKLSECISEDVNIENIDKHKKWLNKLINEDPPLQKSGNIERKIRPNDSNSPLKVDKYEIFNEYNSSLDKNIHIKSEKGFPVLNYQYNNIKDTVLKWNPPQCVDNYNKRNFKRKLRIVKKDEDDNNSNKNSRTQDNNNNNKKKNSDKLEFDEDTAIPIIGELRSESEINRKNNLEEQLYVKQYYEEIKSNATLLEYIKERNEDENEFNNWLENTQNGQVDDVINDSKNNITSNKGLKGKGFSLYKNKNEKSTNLSIRTDKKDDYSDDEALDLHFRNDYRRFDIILNSDLFGYCDLDDSDVVTNILKIGNHSEVDNIEDKKSKKEVNSSNDHSSNGKATNDDSNTNNSSVNGNINNESNNEIKKKADSKLTDLINKNEQKPNKSSNYSKGDKIVQKSDNKVKNIGKNSNMDKNKVINTNIINGINYNSLINMLLKAGAEIDEDEEKIIKEEKDQLKKLKLPYNIMNYKTSLLNIEREEKIFTEEEIREYYDKKRRDRIEIRKKVLREEKNMRDYSIKLFYDNPVMLQSYIKRMDNEIDVKKKKYEQEKSKRINLSYRLKFMIERNSELMISNNNIKDEVERLKDDYNYKIEYINEYSSKLNSELSNLENIYQILINSFGMLCQWCVCEPEYLDPECTKEWENSSVSFVPGGRSSHALLLCKRICEFDKRLSGLYKSMYIHNYKNGLKILKKRSKLMNLENTSPLPLTNKENDDLKSST